MFFHNKCRLRQLALLGTVIPTIFLLTGFSENPPTSERYVESDKLFQQVMDNVESSGMQIVSEIDHSRLAAAQGSGMPPARVLIFSDPSLDAAILRANPLAGIDLPMRVLAFEPEDGGGQIIFNPWAYMASRYGLPSGGALESQYNQLIDEAVTDIEPSRMASFEQNKMQPDGIITHVSDFDFATTLENVHRAIANAEGSVVFAEMDFQNRSSSVDVSLPKATLILWGAPVPGAKAMASAPTLGLDAFCQKFMVWEGEDGKVRLSYNDLLALARRQNVRSLPLQVITRQIEHTFKPVVIAETD